MQRLCRQGNVLVASIKFHSFPSRLLENDIHIEVKEGADASAFVNRFTGGSPADTGAEGEQVIPFSDKRSQSVTKPSFSTLNAEDSQVKTSPLSMDRFPSSKVLDFHPQEN